jgi:hypothetical protein
LGFGRTSEYFRENLGFLENTWVYILEHNMSFWRTSGYFGDNLGLLENTWFFGERTLWVAYLSKTLGFRRNLVFFCRPSGYFGENLGLLENTLGFGRTSEYFRAYLEFLENTWVIWRIPGFLEMFFLVCWGTPVFKRLFNSRGYWG